MPREGDQYLVVLSLHVYSIERLTEVAPGLTSVLERLSTEPIEPAFHSVPRDIIAYLVRSKLNAHQILAAVESPQQGLTGFSEITQPRFFVKRR